MYRPEFNQNRLLIIEKLNEIIWSDKAKSELTDNEFKAIITARNFIKVYYDIAEHEKDNCNDSLIKDIERTSNNDRA